MSGSRHALERKTSKTAAPALIRWLLPAVIIVLALADGLLHFVLDFVLFHGNVFGALHFGPPPGSAGVAPPPRPAPPPHNPILQALDISHITNIPLNRLFVMNAIGYLVLVVVFWLGHRLLGRRSWLVDVALMVYAAASIIGWLDVGKPNPDGLGYLSKAIEIVLILAVLAHLWLAPPRAVQPATPRRIPPRAGA